MASSRKQPEGRSRPGSSTWWPPSPQRLWCRCFRGSAPRIGAAESCMAASAELWNGRLVMLRSIDHRALAVTEYLTGAALFLNA
ncbi:hypothetical protein EJB05_15359, partial [Eragrostis curvula]